MIRSKERMLENIASMPFIERVKFWSKFHKCPDTGCWLFTGALSNGYGKYSYMGRQTSAHRIAYILRYGIIGIDAIITHQCHVKRCGNPTHLKSSTHADNSRDEVELRGYEPLNEFQVLEILEMLDKVMPKHRYSRYRLAEVAEKFNTSFETIKSIYTGRSWGNLEEVYNAR